MTAALSALPSVQLEVDTLRFGRLTIPGSMVFHFEHGLPGFEGIDHYAQLPVREGLCWLQAMTQPSLAFLLVEARRVAPEAWLEHDDTWAIVTLGDAPERCTANLRAPLLLDRATQSGTQWISQDQTWSTTHPLDLTSL